MRIPSVNEIKQKFACGTPLARRVVSKVRELFQKGDLSELTEEVLKKIFEETKKEYETPHLRRVINATGVVVHTNLGRAPLPTLALEHIYTIGKYYSNLEFELESGRRGSRYVHVQELLKEITGAESALLVNNNASAVLITLNTLAKGKEVVVSRGELVEIGGSFRIPEVMTWAGCILREVGTTNKTHLFDYERAINENTGLLLKVHKSNYAMVGFTHEVTTEELVALGRKKGIPVMEDLGSGCLIDFSKYELKKEPTVQEVIKAGVDVATFSGDKLLGGPQAGIIVGKKEIIEAIRKNPLNRAIRIDKLTLAGLEMVLRLYREEERAIKEIPVLSMILKSPYELKRKARELARKLRSLALPGFVFEVVPTVGRTGGGALPLLELPSYAVRVSLERHPPEELKHYLRKYEVPIIARLEEDALYLDVRCLFPEDYPVIVKAFERLKEML